MGVRFSRDDFEGRDERFLAGAFRLEEEFLR